jgi:hypothetical protein
MTDWTKQAEEMFKTWSEAQKKIMENWAESMKGMGVPQGTELWEKTLATWEETLEKSTQAQTEWTEKWVENLKSMQGIPEQAVESTEKFLEMSKRWTTTQGEMSSKWFEMLKSLDPSSLTGKMSEAFQNPFQAWQDATKKVMDAQADWMRVWTGSTGEAAEKTDEAAEKTDEK